jgi:hypothetical protein
MKTKFCFNCKWYEPNYEDDEDDRLLLENEGQMHCFHPESLVTKLKYNGEADIYYLAWEMREIGNCGRKLNLWENRIKNDEV